MYLALIVLPLLGSIISGFFGRKIGVSGSQLITCTCVITTTLLAILAFIEVGLNNIPVKIYLFRWIDAELLNVSWSFSFDSLTVSMLIPVLMVSSLVHIYSIGYMSHDPHNQRFFSYLSLFTFMMIILVTGDNYLVMFVGWEGVGVCSYLLVSFWFTRIAANQSSLAAFLTNRVGDCILTIGMFAILWSFGNIDYSTVFSLTPYYSESIIIFVGICLLIGAMAKSSQVGLHVWLPMAMEGPTPVSALIHAATMVTAGVYLLMRSSPLIEYSPVVLICCLWVGAVTTVFSSLIGLFQQDIKKVIAYSTMSQLGMMVIAIGLSSYNIALFHLINHAFYKALLFLGAGAVIHAVADNQDFRKYGGLISYLPLSYSVMLIASLSLVAFPFMTGFYSKDFILESAFGQYKLSGIIVYFIASIGAMFTTLYSVKVLYLTFLANPNGPLTNYKHSTTGTLSSAHEGDIYMSTPLIILAIFSIFYGYITKDIYIGVGSSFFSDNSLFIHPSNEILLDTEFAVPTLFKLLPLFFTITLTTLSILFTEFYPKLLIGFKLSNIGYNIFSFFNQRFLIEMIYNKYITGLVLKLGGQTTKIMDKGVVETFGPYGLEKKLTDISKSINNLSTGVVTSYALYILVGLIFYINIVYLSENTMDYIILVIILYGIVDLKFASKGLYKKSNLLYITSIIIIIILFYYFLIWFLNISPKETAAYSFFLFLLRKTILITHKVIKWNTLDENALDYEFFKSLFPLASRIILALSLYDFTPTMYMSGEGRISMTDLLNPTEPEPNVSSSGPTANTTGTQSTPNISGSQPTVNIPNSQPTANIPVTQPTANVPGPEPTVNPTGSESVVNTLLLVENTKGKLRAFNPIDSTFTVDPGNSAATADAHNLIPMHSTRETLENLDKTEFESRIRRREIDMNNDPAMRQQCKLNTSSFVSSVSGKGVKKTPVDVIAYLRNSDFNHSLESRQINAGKALKNRHEGFNFRNDNYSSHFIVKTGDLFRNRRNAYLLSQFIRRN